MAFYPYLGGMLNIYSFHCPISSFYSQQWENTLMQKGAYGIYTLNTDFSKKKQKNIKEGFSFSIKQDPSGGPFCLVPFYSHCVILHTQTNRSRLGSAGRQHEWITPQFVVMEMQHSLHSLLWTGCYVFSTEGISWMVTAVDPLVMLNCSVWFPTLLSSTRGSRKLLPKAGLELATLPDMELIPMVLSGTVLCVLFWRGLEPLVCPKTLDTWVRLSELNTQLQSSFSHICRNSRTDVAEEWRAPCGGATGGENQYSKYNNKQFSFYNCIYKYFLSLNWPVIIFFYSVNLIKNKSAVKKKKRSNLLAYMYGEPHQHLFKYPNLK